MKSSFVLLVALLVPVLPARAEYKMNEGGAVPVKKPSLKETRKIAFPDKDHPKGNPERDAIKMLSDRYAFPVPRLQYLRDLHHGYADIVPALIVAREAQVEPGRVIKMRDEGQMWPTIAKGFSVSPEIVDQESSSVLKELKKTLPLTAINDQPRRIP